MTDDLPHYRGFGKAGRWDEKLPYEQGLEPSRLRGGPSLYGEGLKRSTARHAGQVLMVMGVALVLLAAWVFWRVLAGGGWS